MSEDNVVRCCPDESVAAAVDFGASYGSAKAFLERACIVETIRGPLPRIEPGAHRAHSIPLQPPLPLPYLQKPLDGAPPPDRGQTKRWPHPNVEES